MSNAKEYLRRVFQSSALDVTVDYETVRGFVEIMAGEPEALRAIDQCAFLTPAQRTRLRHEAQGDPAVDTH